MYVAGAITTPPPPPPPPPPPLANIAIEKRIFASSVLSSEYFAGRANDGIIPPDGSRSSTFISANVTGQWLAVDFGELVTVSSITLYLRRDCCGNELVNPEFRLGGFDVSTRPVLFTYNFLLSQTPTGPGTTGGLISFLVVNGPSGSSSRTTGRILTVRNGNINTTSSMNLAVAELQVYGTPAACTLQVMYGAGYGIDSAALSTSSQPDEGACCQACYSSATCLYWDYVRSSSTCRLKGDQGDIIPPGQSIPGFYQDGDRVAGAKRGVCTYDMSSTTQSWPDPNAIVVWSGPNAFGSGWNRPSQYWLTYFYKIYTTSEPVVNATFHLRADDSGVLFVNGRGLPPPNTGFLYTSINLVAGANMLALRVYNGQSELLTAAAPTASTITIYTPVISSAIRRSITSTTNFIIIATVATA
ncbi:hypothetical protein VOLCADRAFT_94044 [Volvox carteri f. nagariensis]|uniref:Apple domain-containing protein n=1 Tax=Volvox carteri f. nagariensis TaxID=3068 RepID=D8U3S1_VOLCA|nr:uncharacterized protein VOLCADRAFT_94044 [Volvox carteri f. nagariensis]EFJ45660.1 hypothetical protein VOLCADRAFT_94044 [Volvox carteri f. nagariensis]|eukprot:XP_002953350.1 hypothetical protein VOLCADRAFT_94044 [Volvox carteri f. nagariensis]